MVNRVEPSEVIEITGTTISELVLRNTIIPIASNYIDVHLADEGHSVTTLKHIELYLAAHYVTLQDEGGGLIRDAMGDARQEYADIYSDGFSSTRYGQTAISLDSSGTLAALGTAKLKAQIRIV